MATGTASEFDSLLGGGGRTTATTSMAATHHVRQSASPSTRRCLNPNYFVFIGVALAATLMLFESFFVIAPGQVGIVVTLGHLTTAITGPHFRAPGISRLTKMSIKTQLLEQKNTIPTIEGLSVELDTAVLYRVNVDQAGDLFRTVGVDYGSILVEPEAASAVRALTSESEAKALYTRGREVIQETLKDMLTKSLEPRGIIIEDVLLKDVQLPQELSTSIELKAKAEQDAMRMKFVLQKEEQEASRKAIEAQGIAKFQEIVSQGISSNLLKWKGIEATEKFAESSNAKIIVMGNSENGLPVILSATTGDTGTK